MPVIASEDALATERVTDLLVGLLFQVHQFRIPVGGDWTPSGDVVAICGPKSSAVTATAIAHDPVLTFTEESSGRWVITDRLTGEVFASPLDDDPSSMSDVAYLGRLPTSQGDMLIIAGVHALGSVGVVDYLTRNLAQLYQQVNHQRFSLVVCSRHDGETVVESEALCPPRTHT